MSDRLDALIGDVVTREDALSEAIDLQVIEKAVAGGHETAILRVAKGGFRLTVIDDDGFETFDCDWVPDLRSAVAMWLVPPEDD